MNLGYKINLIPAFIHDDGELRVWNNKQNKFISVYFENGLKLLNEKNEDINNYSQNNNVFLKIHLQNEFTIISIALQVLL